MPARSHTGTHRRCLAAAVPAGQQQGADEKAHRRQTRCAPVRRQSSSVPLLAAFLWLCCSRRMQQLLERGEHAEATALLASELAEGRGEHMAPAVVRKVQTCEELSGCEASPSHLDLRRSITLSLTPSLCCTVWVCPTGSLKHWQPPTATCNSRDDYQTSQRSCIWHAFAFPVTTVWNRVSRSSFSRRLSTHF